MCILHVLKSDLCCRVLNDATLSAKDINIKVVAMLNSHYLCVVNLCNRRRHAVLQIMQITSQGGFISAANCDDDGDDVVSYPAR